MLLLIRFTKTRGVWHKGGVMTLLRKKFYKVSALRPPYHPRALARRGMTVGHKGVVQCADNNTR